MASPPVQEPRRHRGGAGTRARALTLAVLIAAACSSGGLATAEIGEPAPPFALTSLEGDAVSLASLRGKPVLITFFASWCLPCKKELPLFLVAQGQHPDLTILGIVFQDEPKPAKAFRDGIGGNWRGLVDPGARVATAFRVRFIPQTFFVGRDGVLRARQIGEISEAELGEKLATIVP